MVWRRRVAASAAAGRKIIGAAWRRLRRRQHPAGTRGSSMLANTASGALAPQMAPLHSVAAASALPMNIAGKNR